MPSRTGTDSRHLCPSNAPSRNLRTASTDTSCTGSARNDFRTPGGRLTEEQITFTLRQAEAGLPVGDVCRKLGVSQATLFRWKQKYGQMGTAEVRRLRQLEDENEKIKQLVADLSPDKKMFQDVLGKKL